MKSISTPFISIVIATYNAESVVDRCLNSIVTQEYNDLEIIIQDGESSDKTKDIIASFTNHSEIHIASFKDNGIYDAWNRALERCRGEWICFLGADDYFIDRKVLNEIALFLNGINTKHHKIVYGINQIVNQYGERLYEIGKPWNLVKNEFNNSMCLPHPGMMHHHSLFNEIGFFDPSYHIAGDYELLLRTLKNNQPAFWPKTICVVQFGGISTQPDNAIRCLIEVNRAQKRHEIKTSNTTFQKKWAIAILRLILWRVIGEKQFRRLLDYTRKQRGLPPFWTRAV